MWKNERETVCLLLQGTVSIWLDFIHKLNRVYNGSTIDLQSFTPLLFCKTRDYPKNDHLEHIGYSLNSGAVGSKQITIPFLGNVTMSS